MCAWLAPLWLAIALPTLVAAGFVLQWVYEDLKASMEKAA